MRKVVENVPVALALPQSESEAVFGTADPSGLEAEQIYEPVVGATVGVWRVRGGSRSAVLKLLALRDGDHPNWRAGADESHWMYWRREACAYESGMFDEFPDGLRAPDCYCVADRSDGSVAVWLEDLPGGCGSDWSADDYAVAGHAFGRWQGRGIVDDGGPLEVWMSRDWLVTYLTQRDVDDELLADDRVWQHPVLADWFSSADVARMRAMRADRPVFLEGLARLPSVVSHLDLHPRNLFADPEGTTAVIDWAFVGKGSVGEDVGNLVPDSVLDFHVPAARIGLLDRVLTDSYLDGLSDAAASINPDLVRLGMTATMAAKYAWIAPAMARAVVEGRDKLNGRPTSEAVAAWAPAVQYLLDRADEARRLIQQ